MGYEMDVLESPLPQNKKVARAVLTLLQMAGLAPVPVPAVSNA